MVLVLVPAAGVGGTSGCLVVIVNASGGRWVAVADRDDGGLKR